MPQPDAADGATPPERLATTRLVLRKLQESDAPFLFEGFASDPSAARYLTWHPHRTVDETEAFVRQVRQDWEMGQNFGYVIDVGDDPGCPVGMIHLRRAPTSASLGYVIAPRAQGRGFATEAVSCLVGWALRQQPIFRVWAYCDVDNPASARVLEKAGMRFEGTLRRYALHPNVSPEPRDAHLYARTR